MVTMVRGIVLLAVLAALAACDGGGTTAQPAPTLTATPLEPSPAITTSPTPGATVSPTATPTPTPSPTEREPTDTDRGRFVASYQPEGASDLEHIAVDLDGDGRQEVLFAYVRNTGGASGADGVSHVDVAWWEGTSYAIGFRDDGGPADRVDRLRVADVNADEVIEVVVHQSVGSSGGSLSLWQAESPGRHRLRPLVAHGGCADGLHTYGVIGASLEDRDGDGRAEIYATCDDSPAPVAAWSTDVYVWTDGAYRLDRTQLPGEGGAGSGS